MSPPDPDRQYDLATVPDVDDETYVRTRTEYLRRVTELRDPLPEALAHREIGYSHGGIARRLDVTEPAVGTWMERIVAEYGIDALETRPQSRPVEALR